MNQPKTPVEKYEPGLSHENMDALTSLFGAFVPTADRFSLVRPHGQEQLSIDVLIKEPRDSVPARCLVVSNNTTDQEVHDRLAAAQVPQLPLVAQTSQLSVFAVKTGLKRLDHEALHGRESSETYISDNETFYELGRLYRSAYNATGKILLDSQPGDSPLMHTAISSFNDGSSFLFLCPPYATDLQDRLNVDDAQHVFVSSVEQHLAATMTYDASEQQDIAKFVALAAQGFAGN